MALTNFKKFCYVDNKFAEKTDLVPEPTHFLLNGGKLYVPDDKYDQFLSVYASSIEAGESLFIVERKSLPVFNLCAEFDIHEKNPLDRDKLWKIVKEVQACVREFFGGSLAVVSTVEPKHAKFSGTETLCIQTGLHFNWKIPVTLEIANSFRVFACQKLNVTCPLKENWKIIFDPALYKGNGLRLLGSHKAIACKKCKSERDRHPKSPPPCDNCQSSGYIDMGRPYFLFAIVDENGEDTKAWDNFPVLIKRVTIRCPLTTPPICPKITTTFVDEEVNQIQKLTDNTVGNTIIKVRHMDDDIDEEKKQALKTLIMSILPSENHITKIVYDDSKMTYYVDTDCHFCLNKYDFHASSTIWFRVNPWGVSQSCFCKKTYIWGPCVKFCSNYKELSDSERNTIFGSLSRAALKKWRRVPYFKREKLWGMLAMDLQIKYSKFYPLL